VVVGVARLGAEIVVVVVVSRGRLGLGGARVGKLPAERVMESSPTMDPGSIPGRRTNFKGRWESTGRIGAYKSSWGWS